MDRAVADRKRPIRKYQILGYLHLLTETIAGLAGAVRRVEREEPGSWFFVTDIAVKTGELLRVEQVLILDIDQDCPLTHFQRGLDGIGQTTFGARLDHKSIYDRFDRMLFVFLQLDL